MKIRAVTILIILALMCGGLVDRAQAAPSAVIDEITIAPSVLNFGNRKAGSISPTQAVKVINTSSAPITLGIMSISGEFAIDNKCNNVILGVSEVCTFLVAFKPTSTGIKNGTVTIFSDTSSSPDSVTLYGVSYPTAQLLQHENFEPPNGLIFRAPIQWETGPVKVPLFAVWDCNVSLSDKCSARLSRNPRWINFEQSIYQTEGSHGPAGTQYYFGLSSKAWNIPSGGKYLVEIAFFDLNSKQVYAQPLSFADGTHDFEMQGKVITIPVAFNYFVYRIAFQKTSGTAWFDNAMVIRLP